jgi:cytoskeletal protein CcmA (bactofilin family)
MALFRKSDDDGGPGVVSLPRIGQTRPVRFNNVSVIASTQIFKGKGLEAEGLIIEGHLECTTAHHQKHLTVGEHSRVKADIHADTVTVLGQLIGDIYSNGRVSLAKGSDVKGDIFCANLFIEEGARFEGKIAMEEMPTLTGKRKEAV